MTDILTDEWFAAVNDSLESLPTGPGGSGIVDIVVTGGEPARLVTRWVVESGRLRSVGTAVDGAEPDATIPQSRADIEALVAGDRDPAVAFMRGDLKPEGKASAVLALLSALARDEARSALKSAAAG